ncbi:uncharacterized protein C8A04DRAFT_36589 [Dichotomopilus funicola]|uniref:F-box domain-containing protein n=1 Tax=Dichotomopilus funicola TaxID=1934379 RepID=A0AAN6V4G1_9PEZI|nr:hypothetical protein C8A04DRAFT_36589 [Dichotomopilus funicola]
MASLIRLVRRPAPEEQPRKSAAAAETLSGSSQPPPDSPDLTQQHTRPRPTFSTLPPEIHLLITDHLIYPDALSLKHTNRYFSRLVDTGVELKVEWLMERRLLHLECPSDSRCDLGSDLRFCRGSVKLLMQRRREHIECESRPGLGCLIYGTATCPHARKLNTKLKKWMRLHGITRAQWMFFIITSVPLLIGWVCMIAVMML